MISYPDRAARQENGIYRWRCEVEAEYEKRAGVYAMTACLIIAAFIMVFGMILSIPEKDWATLGIIAGCDAVFMGISSFIIWLCYRSADGYFNVYELTDEYVKSGTGRYAVYFYFRETKSITFTGKYIELKGNAKSLRVYVPSEDYSLVKGQMTNHIPGTAEVFYLP